MFRKLAHELARSLTESNPVVRLACGVVVDAATPDQLKLLAGAVLLVGVGVVAVGSRLWRKWTHRTGGE